jgi:hypothetical protein
LTETEKILAGRNAVDDYRAAHALLHENPKGKDIAAEHEKLMRTMEADLKTEGFETLASFWIANKTLIPEGAYKHDSELRGVVWR